MEARNRQQQLTGSVVPGPEVEEFANALDICLASGLSVSEKKARILDLPRKYHENAIRRLAHKRPKRIGDGVDDMDMDVDEQSCGSGQSDKPDEVKQLEKEVQTWDLFRRLLPLRYGGSKPEPMRFSSAFSASKSTTRNHVNDFLETNSLALERRAVLQWLQTNAAAGPDIDELAHEFQHNADRGDIIAHGWLHTRSKIKLRKSVTAWPHLLDRQSPNVTASHLNSNGAPLVTHLDPDASTRQSRKLEPQDGYFERAIWLGCFEHLRRGSSFEDIREWCQERTEMWRAVSMFAMPLPVDDKQESEPNADPASLTLWRRMCFALAKQGGTDDYERAVYGVLSGDIFTVEKVAKSWDDYLFANYNALLRSQIDGYMTSKCPPEVVSTLTQSFSAFDAVQFHGGDDNVERRLVQAIGSNPSLAAEANEPNKALQASFIAKELDRHLYEQGLVITESANEFSKSRLVRKGLGGEQTLLRSKFFDLAQHSGLRIAAHVFVLIALLKRFELQEFGSYEDKTPAVWRFSQENILAGYTDYLRRSKLQELIPLYCSILDSSRCYEILSWNVIEDPDPENRITQLKLIKRAGIDVLTFVETQANLLFNELDQGTDSPLARNSFNILESGPPTSRHGRIIKADFFGEEEDVVDTRDVHVIRALEWLLTVDETWPRVFSIGTRVYKFFLRNGRLNAARRLLGRVAFAEIMRDMTDHNEPDLALYDDVDFWAQQLEQSGIRNIRPEQVMTDARNYRELEALVKALDSLETMASLVVISLGEITATREFWGRVGNEIKTTKHNMQPLLQNWLLSGIEGGDEELQQLRQTYLPETILAYVSALHFAGTGLSRDNLLECMELASVIAERNSDLATTFVNAGRMTELVQSFTACSKALAIATGEKRAAGSTNKKLREMGWSRDLWAVKH
ncbi:Nucleoporin nup84 [Conoideocrella luteorostrata]|uniref:Nuclear pore complex protein n=1 Tax=Conoideocrella luteorostrata TaxID=1105319 RepID=A0AAJ0FYF8_9HYPO|nr:Nucleoporin nup84 [Conoideocrella luteorostrata]